VKLNVEEWKTRREVEKIEQRADRSEEYAEEAISLAMATIEEADEAILAAISTRLDAEVALTKEK